MLATTDVAPTNHRPRLGATTKWLMGWYYARGAVLSAKGAECKSLGHRPRVVSFQYP